MLYPACNRMFSRDFNSMRRLSFSPASLRKLLLREKIATLPDLKRALGTDVNLTVIRRLKQLGYLTSYSHGGRYLTLTSGTQPNRSEKPFVFEDVDRNSRLRSYRLRCASANQVRRLSPMKVALETAIGVRIRKCLLPKSPTAARTADRRRQSSIRVRQNARR